MLSSSTLPERNHQGSMEEVFNYQTAKSKMLNYKLDTTDYNSVIWMGQGKFSIKIVTEAVNAITIAFCSLDGFQWPLAKDMPVVRIGRRTFVIGFPSLVYALQFPAIFEPKHIISLEKNLMRLTHYHNYADYNFQCYDYPLKDNDPDLWKVVRSIAEPIAHEILTKYGHLPELSRFSMLNHNSCFVRAARLCAATKTIVNAMISGVILPNHIIIQYPVENYCTHNSGPASSSISSFINLVDALEASLLESQGLSSHVLNTLPALQTYPNPGFKVWRLNESGHIIFIKNLESVAAKEAQVIISKTRASLASRYVNNDKGKGIQVSNP